jgi:hypothetical protein
MEGEEEFIRPLFLEQYATGPEFWNPVYPKETFWAGTHPTPHLDVDLVSS